jgi:hypothetical protein
VADALLPDDAEVMSNTQLVGPAGRRAVVELLAHLASDGRELAWPMAVVAEIP